MKLLNIQTKKRYIRTQVTRIEYTRRVIEKKAKCVGVTRPKGRTGKAYRGKLLISHCGTHRYVAAWMLTYVRRDDAPVYVRIYFRI